MLSGQALTPNNPVTLSISRKELEEYLLEHKQFIEAHQKKKSHSASFFNYLNPSYYYPKRPATDKATLAGPSWAKRIQHLLDQYPGCDVLEGEALCQLFLILVDWESEKDVLEKGIFSFLIEKFDSPLKNVFWDFLCKMDHAGLFRPKDPDNAYMHLTAGGEKVGEDDSLYQEIKYETLHLCSAEPDEAGKRFFCKLLSKERDVLKQWVLTGTCLLKVSEKAHWHSHVFRKFFARLMDMDADSLEFIGKQCAEASGEELLKPEFWQNCFDALPQLEQDIQSGVLGEDEIPNDSEEKKNLDSGAESLIQDNEAAPKIPFDRARPLPFPWGFVPQHSVIGRESQSVFRNLPMNSFLFTPNVMGLVRSPVSDSGARLPAEPPAESAKSPRP